MLIGIGQFCDLNNTSILFTEETRAVPEQERKEGEICGKLKSCDIILCKIVCDLQMVSLVFSF